MSSGSRLRLPVWPQPGPTCRPSGGGSAMPEDRAPVRVSRRIEAPADQIFELLADPRRHTELDGSGMLRGAVSDETITRVGDAFEMRMHLDEIGDYVMRNY